MPYFSSVDFVSIAEALGYGASLGQVFKADGAGSGAMGKNVQGIHNSITVGKSGDVDFTSIKAANDFAVAEGATVGNEWQVKIYPGTYAEDPTVLMPGVNWMQAVPSRMNSVFMQANDPDEDLVTVYGGGIIGLQFMGVTNASKAVVRATGATTFIVMDSCALFRCSNGVIVENGATGILTQFGSFILSPGDQVGTAAQVTGAGSFMAIVAGFFAVPPGLLPYYSVNPIQTAVACKDQGELQSIACSYRIAPKDTTQCAVHVDGGGLATVNSSEFTLNAIGLQIGATGANSEVVCQSSSFKYNTLNMKIDSSTGTIYTNVSVDASKRSVVAGGKITGLIQYRDTKHTALEGAVRYRFDSGRTMDLAQYFNLDASTGVVSGGEVTAGTGLHVNVAAGIGLVRRESPDFDAWDVAWDAATAVDLTASTTNYVFYNAITEAVEVGLSAPGAIGILLETVVTDGSGIRFMHRTRRLTAGLAALLATYLETTRKVYLASGIVPSTGTGVRNIDVGSGSYFLALDLITYAGASDATFSAFYGTNGATEVASQTQVNITQYDVAGTLTAMTAGYFRSDTLVLTSDGRLSLIYGTEEFATQVLAEVALTGNVPTFMQASAFPVARVVVEQGVGIATFVDIRPQDGAGGGGSAGVSSHSALDDLDQPGDHLWAMLVDGTRAMTGALNMGNQNITNAGTVNGVSVTAHNARHQPGGADAIATAAPTGVLVAGTAAEGSATSLARSDHQHGIATGTPESVGAANAPGSSSSVPRLDHVHGHGSQAGGTTHAVATTSVDGFESAADKTKLDGIAAGATATPLTSTAPVNVTKATAAAGTAVEAARQDHKHDVTTAAPASGAVAVGNAAADGSATSLSRSDHQHAVAAGTPVDVGASNAAGSATTFARSDHAHAGLTRGAADFGLFTAKAYLGVNDVFLIEDGDAANVKKKVASSTLISIFTPVFGANPHYVESEADSTTTSTAYQAKVTMTTVTLPAGTYHIGWCSEMRNDSGASDSLLRVQVDGTNTLCEPNIEPKDTTNYYPVNGFRQVTFATAAAHTIIMAYRSETAGVTSYIRRARLQLYRVY